MYTVTFPYSVKFWMEVYVFIYTLTSIRTYVYGYGSLVTSVQL